MNILISNDDGIDAEGLVMLAETLAARHNVLVVAPEGERSAFSHKLTMHEVMFLKEKGGHNPKWQSFSGSPADCIKFTHSTLKDFKIDVVVGGINRGENLGTDIMYSGTCAVAREGAYLGIPSIAFSLCRGDEYNYDYAISYIDRNFEDIVAMCAADTFINVNFPNICADKILGTKVCPVGRLEYNEIYSEEGGGYFLRGVLNSEHKPCQDTDCSLIRSGYVTISPVYIVKTNDERLVEIKDVVSQWK